MNVKIFNAEDCNYPLLPNALASPGFLYIEITKKCNNACAHCYMDANNNKHVGKTEITFDKIKKTIEQFSAYGGYSVRLTGGEPTIRSDFFDIVDVINQEGLMLSLNTNGIIGEATLAKLFDKVKDLRLSLDGTEAINDQIRGHGTYKKILNTLKSLVDYNSRADDPVELTLNVVLMRRNLVCLEDLIKLAKQNNVKIKFNLLKPFGRITTEIKQQMLTPAEVSRVAHKINSLRRQLGLTPNDVKTDYDIYCDDISQQNQLPFAGMRCRVTTYGIGLNAFGKIMICGYLNDDEQGFLEDFTGEDLLYNWHYAKMINLLRAIKTPEICNSCTYQSSCNGGCPAIAYAIEKNFDGKDPYCPKGVMVN